MPFRTSAARVAAVAALSAAAFVAACTSGNAAQPHANRAADPTTATTRARTSTAATTARPSATQSSSAASRTSSPSRTAAPSTATDSSTAAPPPSTPAQQTLARMTLRQRAGQLLMVDCPSAGVAPATRIAIRRYHVGAVILDGNNTAGVSAVRAVTDRVQRLAPRSVGLFVATDQEGGFVQRLRGPGFSTIPSGVQQGAMAAGRLRHEARRWGAELKRAGVNVNLAPVLDVVPRNFGSNPPIGDLDRELGHTPHRVSVHGVAIVQGMAAARVDTTAKHFPGLGRVRGNTDTTAGVTDTVTTRHDRYLAPFHAAIRAGVPFLMISSAIYQRIDPQHPAVFSHTVVTDMARDDLGFRGVIISDDLGGAAQVSSYPVGARAVDFVASGGDIVLTVNAAQAGRMTAALIRRARQSPVFKQKLDEAALRVLEAKAHRGLLG